MRGSTGNTREHCALLNVRFRPKAVVKYCSYRGQNGLRRHLEFDIALCCRQVQGNPYGNLDAFDRCGWANFLLRLKDRFVGAASMGLVARERNVGGGIFFSSKNEPYRANKQENAF